MEAPVIRLLFAKTSMSRGSKQLSIGAEGLSLRLSLPVPAHLIESNAPAGQVPHAASKTVRGPHQDDIELPAMSGFVLVLRLVNLAFPDLLSGAMVRSNFLFAGQQPLTGRSRAISLGLV